MGKFTQKLVVRQFLRATLEKHSLFALSKEDFWNRDPCLDFLRKIYLRNWLGAPVSTIDPVFRVYLSTTLEYSREKHPL